MKGEYIDTLVYPDGRREEVGRGHNRVMNTAYVVLAMCMKQDPAFGGFLYWALGDGNTVDSAAWDAGVTNGTNVPAATETALRNEIYRKAVTAGNIVFVDAAGAVSASPTNRLQVTVTFTETQPSSAPSTNLREWGLFGGNATGTAGSGQLINLKFHRTYAKTNVAQLERKLIFTF